MPKPPTLKQDRTYYTALGISLLVLVTTAIAAHAHTLSGLNARIFHDINNVTIFSHSTAAINVVSDLLGSVSTIAIVVLIALACRRRYLAWRLFVTSGLCVLIFYLIKRLINEPRPVVLLHGQLQQRIVETTPSFPSGHVSAATALAVTILLVLPPKYRWLPVLWIGLTMFTRLYLGVHTPIDVIAGVATGIIAVCIVRLLPTKLRATLRLDRE